MPPLHNVEIKESRLKPGWFRAKCSCQWQMFGRDLQRLELCAERHPEEWTEIESATQVAAE